MSACSRTHLAIQPLNYTKPETKLKGGLAIIAQKVEVAESKLVMDFMDTETGRLWKTGDYVILAGDSGLHPWNKRTYDFENETFVLCPANEVIGFRTEDK